MTPLTHAGRSLATTAVTLLVVVVVAMTAGQAFGQPVAVSYVTTGSMAPTLAPGDGFVAVPAALAAPIEVGDVIVFEAERVGGGGLTTHRVVAVTDRGYVTRGDANPSTDQAGDEPVVTDLQIVATALQIDGTIVRLPGVGTAVETVRSVFGRAQTILFGAVGVSPGRVGLRETTALVVATLVALSILDVVRPTDDRRMRSDRTRDTGVATRTILATLALVVAVTATAAMVVPAGTVAFDVVSATLPSERGNVIVMGESREATYLARNGGLVPVVVYLTPGSEGVAVSPAPVAVGPREFVDVPVTLTAPADTGFYRLYVVEYRYLDVLPAGVLDALFQVHPWLPIVVIDTLLAAPVYLLGRRVVGVDRVRFRGRPGVSRLAVAVSTARWLLR